MTKYYVLCNQLIFLFAACLIYIARALERDNGYTKGIVLREQIFKEQPSFRQQSSDLFKA